MAARLSEAGVPAARRELVRRPRDGPADPSDTVENQSRGKRASPQAHTTAAPADAAMTLAARDGRWGSAGVLAAALAPEAPPPPPVRSGVEAPAADIFVPPELRSMFEEASSPGEGALVTPSFGQRRRLSGPDPPSMTKAAADLP